MDGGVLAEAGVGNETWVGSGGGGRPRWLFRGCCVERRKLTNP